MNESLPPPGDGPAGLKTTVVELEGTGGLRKLVGRRGENRLSINAAQIIIEHGGHLQAPLQLAPGGIAVAALDPGPAKVGPSVGRFPILHRLSTTAVVPREEGIEGWLWTSAGGSAYTVIGDEDAAPNLALVFSKPLEADVVAEVFDPGYLEDMAKRSPLGSPTVFGVLLRVVEPEKTRVALQRLSLTRPLTDREIPPTQRRHLPTDKPANPTIAGSGDSARAQTSVPPPGGG
jgi:hypothetical protein